MHLLMIIVILLSKTSYSFANKLSIWEDKLHFVKGLNKKLQGGGGNKYNNYLLSPAIDLNFQFTNSLSNSHQRFPLSRL